MAHALFERCTAPLTGVVIGTHGDAPAGLRWHRKRASGARRAQRARRARRADAGRAQCAPDDHLVVLVSGGASSLMALAADGVAFADKQAVIGRLLAEGADITALNCVRKHLSAIKGGRLAQACRAPLDAWLLSDVVGDDPSVIGSGPTVPDPTTFGDALDVLDRFGGRAAYPRGRRRAPRGGRRRAHRRDAEAPGRPGARHHARDRVGRPRARRRRRRGASARLSRSSADRRRSPARRARRPPRPRGLDPAHVGVPGRTGLRAGQRRDDRARDRAGPRRAQPGVRAGRGAGDRSTIVVRRQPGHRRRGRSHRRGRRVGRRAHARACPPAGT